MKDFDEALAEILATIPGPLAAEQVACSVNAFVNPKRRGTLMAEANGLGS